jgi:HEAT repeat protein
MRETPCADALLTHLISGTGEVSYEGFATLTDEHEREKALYVLIALLTDADSRLRIRATQALGAMGDKRAVDPLINSLDDTDDVFEAELFDTKFAALAALGASEAIQPLFIHSVSRNHWIMDRRVHTFDRNYMLHVLSDALTHPDDRVRYSVIQALGEIDDPGSVRLLINALNEDSYRLRSQSLYRLVKLRAVDAAPALMRQTSDPNVSIRQLTALALGILGDQQAIPVLLPLLNDEDEQVRLNAACGLGRLGDSTGADLIRAFLVRDQVSNLNAVDTALKAFQTLHLPAVPLLIDLADKVLAQRPEGHKTLIRIAEIFAEQGASASLPVLERMLESDAEALQAAAQRAIEAIKGQMGR